MPQKTILQTCWICNIDFRPFRPGKTYPEKENSWSAIFMASYNFGANFAANVTYN